MINLAYTGKNRGLVSYDTEHMPKPNSSLNLKLGVRTLQMYICTLWMMPATRLTALGQHKYRPTANHAGLVTQRDLLVPARSWRNAGTQVVLVLFDPSSLIHLAPIPARTCLPTASQPNLLSLAINTKTSISIFYLFPGQSPFLLSTQAQYSCQLFIALHPILGLFPICSTCSPASWQDIWMLLTSYLPTSHQSSSPH